MKKSLRITILIIVGIVIVFLILSWAFGLFGGKDGIPFAPGDCYCDSCRSCTNQLGNASCNIVYLTQDLDTNFNFSNGYPHCIELKYFNANGRIFDCLMFNITGFRYNENTSGAIVLVNISNLTIRNCGFDSHRTAIFISRGFSINITNNIFNLGRPIKDSRSIYVSDSSEIDLKSIILKYYDLIGISIIRVLNVSFDNISACGSSSPSLWPPDISVSSGSIITKIKDVYCNFSEGMNCNYSCNRDPGLENGTLTILSTQSQTNISIDGTYQGYAPITRSLKSNKIHTCTASKQGYKSETRTIILNPGEVYSWNFNLSLIPPCNDSDNGLNYTIKGNVTTISPSATTWDKCLRDQQGVSPGQEQLLWERYCSGVSMATKNYDCKSEGKYCEDGRCSVNTTVGFIYAVSNPAGTIGAQVYYKNFTSTSWIYFGTTPTIVKNLKPGQYNVKISKSGWYENISQVNVFAGNTTKLNVTLNKI
jgi:hypothetical protein